MHENNIDIYSLYNKFKTSYYINNFIFLCINQFFYLKILRKNFLLYIYQILYMKLFNAFI